jgi:TRAP-type uncharacterized transport system substrate-binding protein
LQSTSTAILRQRNPPLPRKLAAQPITQNKGDTNMKKITLIVLAVLSAFSGNALSADDKDFAGCDGNQVIIGTGLATAPYSQMMQTPIKMAPHLMCEYRGSTGGMENVTALVERKIDAGLVQADVLDFMKRTEPMVSKKIRSLIALHSNYLHIFKLRGGVTEKKNIIQKQVVVMNSLRDLKGRRIATFGSAYITARTINERLNLGMGIVEVATKEEGIAKLKKGEVYAFFAMGGKPIPWVEKDIDGNAIALVNVEPADITALGQPYYVGKLSYKKLGVAGINAVAVRNDLVVWDFTGKRAEQLLELRKFFKQNLEDIKDTRGAHPAWQDVELSSLDELSWQKFQPTGSGGSTKSYKKKK